MYPTGLSSPWGVLGESSGDLPTGGPRGLSMGWCGISTSPLRVPSGNALGIWISSLPLPISKDDIGRSPGVYNLTFLVEYDRTNPVGADSYWLLDPEPTCAARREGVNILCGWPAWQPMTIVYRHLCIFTSKVAVVGISRSLGWDPVPAL